MKAQQQDQAPYFVERQAIQTVGEDDIIRQALAILERRVKAPEAVFHTPDAVKQFLVMRNAAEGDQFVERFTVLFLDTQNRMVAIENMFTGTLSQTSVYPREIVRAALKHNASAVVLSHNHPSGSVQPSRADEHLTQTLKAALALVDCRVLDHIITGPGGQSLSMAEKGLM
jgi:DNA repair protein RadC